MNLPSVLGGDPSPHEPANETEQQAGFAERVFGGGFGSELDQPKVEAAMGVGARQSRAPVSVSDNIAYARISLTIAENDELIRTRNPIMVTPRKPRSQSTISSSLAYRKFILRHEAEIIAYWFQQVSTIYATRWVNEHRADLASGLASFPGDGETPFRNLGGTSDMFLAHSQHQSKVAGHAAIVRLVTAFENFLYDCIQRAVFLNPRIILKSDGKSDININASDLSHALTGESARSWFAHHIADKLCRGKSPDELVTRVDALLKAGVESRLRAEITEWVRWTLVRNAIVHLGSDVTAELAAKWPSRFPTSGAKITLDYKDVLRVAFLSRTIGKQLDLGQVPIAARSADRDLLASELFIRDGIDDPGELSFVVSTFLSVRATRQYCVGLIAQVRRGPQQHEGFVVTDEMIAAAMVPLLAKRAAHKRGKT